MRIVVQDPARKHGQASAVAASVSDFAFPSVLTKQLLVDFRQPRRKFCFQQMVYYFAQCFVSRIAIKFRRPFVPVGDPIVFVANNDGVVGQIQQARLFGELLFVAFALAQIDNGGLKEQRAVSRRRSDWRT